jgi:hypothetical protein
MLDAGPKLAAGQVVPNPLPVTWLGLATVTPTHPLWANINNLTSTQTRNLLAQISYDASAWNYQLIGTNNQLGRYQVSTNILESYGILAPGSNTAYGTGCIYYRHCWQQNVMIKSNANGNYTYNVASYQEFLNSNIAQEHLAYQLIYDMNQALVGLNAIKTADTADVIAGMIYVGWTLGTGTAPVYNNTQGSGAYAWRYSGVGAGIPSYNSGRYAINILSQ